ncbi:hypothetical protein [Archangium lansingense]|uniref:Uncharacterized protein n=1 Tax=Archangium lansingense TaxID=2995310 RepID=A0ABT3ZZZ8_9BACT|nr:hypothetical protein [Archangium lansinium]MCY1074968.1 hypothetical protein [Archangium lansinium]
MCPCPQQAKENANIDWVTGDMIITGVGTSFNGDCEAVELGTRKF